MQFQHFSADLWVEYRVCWHTVVCPSWSRSFLSITPQQTFWKLCSSLVWFLTNTTLIQLYLKALSDTSFQLQIIHSFKSSWERNSSLKLICSKIINYKLHLSFTNVEAITRITVTRFQIKETSIRFQIISCPPTYIKNIVGRREPLPLNCPADWRSFVPLSRCK